MFNEEFRLEKPLRWAMIGGGRGSQIGNIHRNAAKRYDLFNLVAGAFDIDEDRCRDFGVNLGLDSERCYADYKQMFAQEAKRADGIEAVSIATPNCFHYEMVKTALEHGIHVVCEKPITFTVEEAEELKALSETNNLALCVAYGYTGHQMLHHAREMVKRGEIGEVRVINTMYAHGWHNEEVEVQSPGLKWRVTPEVSGPSYVLGDTGTHAQYLVDLITGERLKRLLCYRQSFIKSRAPLEDNAHVLMEYESGAVGTMWVSAINSGAMHSHKIRVIGSKASLEWWDEQPNQLRYEVQGEPVRILERGHGYLHHDNEMVSADHIGAGHAEGLFESWANIYCQFAKAMDAKNRDDQAALAALWYPNIDDGIEGVRLIERCVESADAGAVWIDYK